MADEIPANQNNTVIPPVTVTKAQNMSNGSKIFNVSTRSLIALILILSFCGAVLAHIGVPDKFTDLVEMVSAFYFGHSIGSNNNNGKSL
jgi:hypothetical protein